MANHLPSDVTTRLGSSAPLRMHNPARLLLQRLAERDVIVAVYGSTVASPKRSAATTSSARCSSAAMDTPKCAGTPAQAVKIAAARSARDTEEAPAQRARTPEANRRARGRRFRFD